MLESWREFLTGKRKRKDISEFSLRFIDNTLSLYKELSEKTYKHGGYQAFKINDPKPRDIHKASVRDRLLHHAIYKILYPYFDKKFIPDSFSCRLNKGTHKAVNKFREFYYKVGKNSTKTCWVLKCDIRKFFANINHEILKGILAKYIEDKDILWLLSQIIDSFNSKRGIGVGLPLGNLTSQLFVNIYLNELDQFIKHKLKAKYYIRYCDDFMILGENKEYLTKLIPLINNFLKEKLNLTLHSDKVIIKKYHQGIDFLGYVALPHYRVLRTKTKTRIFKKIRKKQQDLQKHLISEESFNQSLQSYFGILKHCNGYKIKKRILLICKKFQRE